jgi:hypothetical protein
MTAPRQSADVSERDADRRRLVRRHVDAIRDVRRDIMIVAPEGLAARHGEPLELTGQITNTSDSTWPVIVAGEPALRVGAELYSGDEREKVAVARFDIASDSIAPGQSVEFTIALPTVRAAVGHATVRVDLLYEGVMWFYSRGGAMPEGDVVIRPAVHFDTVDPSVPVESPVFWQQHVPDYSPRTEIGLVSPRFQEYLVPTAVGDVHVKSMLTMDELAVLYALARHHFGEGKIADLGPLLGIGTHVMARGVAQNSGVRHKDRCIYAYDLFLEEHMMHFLPDSDRAGTGSVFWRFLQLNHEFLETVVPVPGDFLKMRWTGDPIEILFIDLAKTWDLNRHVLREFFPCLIPGHSIVLQQDYVHVGEPWVALTMELLDEYFERLYLIYGCTAVYRCVKPILKDLLERDLEAMPLAECDALFERAQARAQPSVRQVLMCCQAAIRIEKGDLEGAARLADSVDLDAVDPGVIPAQEFSRAIFANLTTVRRWLDRARSPQRGTS